MIRFRLLHKYSLSWMFHFSGQNIGMLRGLNVSTLKFNILYISQIHPSPPLRLLSLNRNSGSRSIVMTKLSPQCAVMNEIPLPLSCVCLLLRTDSNLQPIGLPTPGVCDANHRATTHILIPIHAFSTGFLFTCIDIRGSCEKRAGSGRSLRNHSCRCGSASSLTRVG